MKIFVVYNTEMECWEVIILHRCHQIGFTCDPSHEDSMKGAKELAELVLAFCTDHDIDTIGYMPKWPHMMVDLSRAHELKCHHKLMYWVNKEANSHVH